MTTTFIQFAKMHGLGNDFMVIDAINQSIDDAHLPVTQLADRHTGVGFDQLLIIKPSGKADFYCRIFNADGSEAEQCGNGLRCIAKYVYENNLTRQTAFTIETLSGIYPASIHLQSNIVNHISILMGAPTVTHPDTTLTLDDGQQVNNICLLSVGNPHAVLKVSDINSINMYSSGNLISTHHAFPSGANVGFMQIINPQHIRLRTYERGLGETHACGSNACAAVVTGITHGWLDKEVEVAFRHGSLTIGWPDNSQPIQMSGPATLVYTGSVCLDT